MIKMTKKIKVNAMMNTMRQVCSVSRSTVLDDEGNVQAFAIHLMDANSIEYTVILPLDADVFTDDGIDDETEETEE